MPRNLVPRFQVSLDLTTLDDTELHQVVADIQAASATSQAVQNSPAMLACIASMALRAAALAKLNEAVGDDRVKLRQDLASEAQARSAVRADVRSFATLLSGAVQSPGEIQQAGMRPRGPTVRTRLPPAPPDLIWSRAPQRGHGRITVSVQETGPIRREYVAEQSADGITWSPLGVGHGKTRVVTGASGTKVWVRFATVRAGSQSDWSTPHLVTIP
jgi:hypothetical protein